VALQLAALGVAKLTLYDDDIVGCENLAPQGYFVNDVGKAKVTVTAALCHQLNPEVQVQPHEERFRRSTVRNLVFDRPLIVFACVDSISMRKLLWEALYIEASFFVDGRMSAEVLRVLAVATPVTDRAYARTLFDESEAFVGVCTARSTIYTASIAAGLMIGQFTRWLRDLPVDGDLTLNLLASELTITSAVGS
jgi:molybdopterin-synthase adenylyltransferase